MSVREQTEKWRIYEAEGRYDEDVMPYDPRKQADIDGNYRYFRHGFWQKAGHAFFFFLLTLLWRPVLFFTCGFRVRGKKNRKVKGGAISVSNHTHYLDAVMVHALHKKVWKVYHTGAPFNVKKGVLGWMIKEVNYLPFSASYEAQKNLRGALQNLLARGNVIHFYPERALWIRYEKVRPFKPGAFKYAAKFSVPVIPSLITYEDTKFRKFFHMKKRAVLNILPPVYPDGSLTERENAAAMQKYCEDVMRETYERIYGRKMVLCPSAAAIRDGGAEPETKNTGKEGGSENL